MSKTLLLLAAPSRESQDKAAHFARAAAMLGLPSRILLGDSPVRILAQAGDIDLLFAIACSDALALAAAGLNDHARAGGLSRPLTASLIDKAHGIPALSRMLDLPLLPQCIPMTPAEIRAWPWRNAIIVKPTRSSGGWSPQPWGYRRFETSADFLRWLDDNGQMQAFFAEQRQPGPLGPSLLQAAVDGDRVDAATILLTPTRTQILCRSYGDFEPDGGTGAGRRWYRAIYHEAASPMLAERLSRLELLRRHTAGWGRGLLYVQGINGPDGLHLTDINIRMSTAWDWLASRLDPDWHCRLLGALLFDLPFAEALPAAATALDLVHGDPQRRIAAIEHPALPPHILPLRLTPEACTATAQGFDKAGAAPAFATLADDIATCVTRAEAFRAGLRVAYATPAAA